MMLRSISTPSAPGSAYYPPASYYNMAVPNEDEDDDDDESLGDKLKAAAGNFRNNKSLLYIVIALAVVLIAAIVLLVVSNNNKQIQAMNAAATQEAISIADTQEAVMAMIEGQRQQTQEAEQMIAAQTQEAIEAEAAAAAAAAAAIPTPDPIQIPVSPMSVPTAVSTAKGRFQSQTPADNTNFIMGEAFTVTWNMENTGSTNWDYNFKLVFDSGTNFTVGQITEKITEAEIWPGGAAGISLPCIAPLYPGSYTMSWHVEDTNGSSVFSPLTITINAVEGVLTPTPGPTPDGYIAPTLPSDIYIAN